MSSPSRVSSFAIGLYLVHGGAQRLFLTAWALDVVASVVRLVLAAFPEAQFQSIQVNSGFQATVRTDSQNHGPAFVCVD